MRASFKTNVTAMFVIRLQCFFQSTVLRFQQASILWI